MESLGAILKCAAKAWKPVAAIPGRDLLHKRYWLVCKKGFWEFTLTWLGLNVNMGQDVAVHVVNL